MIFWAMLAACGLVGAVVGVLTYESRPLAVPAATPARLAALEHEALEPRSQEAWGHGSECVQCGGGFAPMPWSPALVRDTIWPDRGVHISTLDPLGGVQDRTNAGTTERGSGV